MFARKVHNLRHFCLGNLVRKNAAFSDAVMVHMKHDTRRILAGFLEKPFQNMHDELHGRVIVIQQQHPVLARAFDLRLYLRDDDGARAGIVVIVPIVVRTQKDASVS